MNNNDPKNDDDPFSVLTALVLECHHVRPSLLHATCYCLCVASAFVGSLYMLVPAQVRKLDRDDPVQIQWRTFATAIVCLGAILAYPYTFCTTTSDAMTTTNTVLDDSNDPVLARMGFLVYRVPLWNMFGALSHAMALYMGPITAILFQAKLIALAQAQRSYSTANAVSSTPPPSEISISPTEYWEALSAILFPPQTAPRTDQQRKTELWVSLRSKVIAPILEEIAFRGCIVPALTATRLFHPWAIAWITPVFFGLAHCHHAMLKLQQGDALSQVITTTLFQFLYTSLFGAYAAHAFLRTKSIVAVILSHSFCNTMGLPSGDFLNNQSNPLYHHRLELIKAYLLGIAMFIWGFTTNVFLPIPS